VHEFKNRAERFGEWRGSMLLAGRDAGHLAGQCFAQEINQYIHRSMREAGHVTGTEFRVPVLTARQDMTGADRQHAQNYVEGDVIRYTKGSKPLGIEAGELCAGGARGRGEQTC